jgi:hypothetical protein
MDSCTFRDNENHQLCDVTQFLSCQRNLPNPQSTILARMISSQTQTFAFDATQLCTTVDTCTFHDNENHQTGIVALILSSQIPLPNRHIMIFTGMISSANSPPPSPPSPSRCSFAQRMQRCTSRVCENHRTGDVNQLRFLPR